MTSTTKEVKDAKGPGTSVGSVDSGHGVGCVGAIGVVFGTSPLGKWRSLMGSRWVRPV